MKQSTLNKNIERRPLTTPTDLHRDSVKDIAAAMNGILPDVFTLYIKTKNFRLCARI